MRPISGQQAHTVDPCDSGNRNHIRDVLKINSAVRFDIRDALDTNGKNVAQPIPQLVPWHRFFIHHHLGMLRRQLRRMNLNHNRPLRRRD
jgi:hypothetical protein